jgi:hypothetical protein
LPSKRTRKIPEVKKIETAETESSPESSLEEASAIEETTQKPAEEEPLTLKEEVTE